MGRPSARLLEARDLFGLCGHGIAESGQTGQRDRGQPVDRLLSGMAKASGVSRLPMVGGSAVIAGGDRNEQ
ncbi:hypothetical protein [Thalassospira sp. A3_1]|uniref:hypothetical protein n=1 Tax=Thalassospira sp. A3_1 TaxID=2821088 RepID=UPI001ADB64A5|nr:hypothetical protein [Thalassospira sp. A3_1]MBO9505951.1 hypothetical protein [Thalassospira sp. A3_1]